MKHSFLTIHPLYKREGGYKMLYSNVLLQELFMSLSVKSDNLVDFNMTLFEYNIKRVNCFVTCSINTSCVTYSGHLICSSQHLTYLKAISAQNRNIFVIIHYSWHSCYLILRLSKFYREYCSIVCQNFDDKVFQVVWDQTLRKK